MCQHLNKGRVTKLPPHGGQMLGFIHTGIKETAGLPEAFNYVAPVVKYSPACFQPGPVYRSGLAAAVGHQPWNWSDRWTAYSTPSQMDWAYGPIFKGTQSAASFAVAQNAISQMLQLRSINANG